MFFCCSTIVAEAQTNYQRIKSFGVPAISGYQPVSKPIEGNDGFLYGVTYTGGSNNVGVIYRAQRTGHDYSVLYHFLTGAFPVGEIMQGSDGSLYGTTQSGGSNNLGIVYTLATNGGNFKVLHTFVADGIDGSAPAAGLLQGSDGSLYGTTASGGSNNLGTVFRLQNDGSGYTILHHFTGSEGSSPVAPLIQGNDQRLYGTARDGGTSNFGTVFCLDTNGNNYAILHQFAGGNADGRSPRGSLAFGTNGSLYGVSYYGATNDLGTIFKLDADGGNYGLLHSFEGGASGYQPWGGLVSMNGEFYGTTRFGGSNDVGTVYRCALDGNFAVLRHFEGDDGSQPQAGLLAGTDGVLYGVTTYGGTANLGVMFKLFSGRPLISISNIQLTQTGALLTCNGGIAGSPYQIEANSNLLEVSGWTAIATNYADLDGVFQSLDADSSNYLQRFYRIRAP